MLANTDTLSRLRHLSIHQESPWLTNFSKLQGSRRWMGRRASLNDLVPNERHETSYSTAYLTLCPQSSLKTTRVWISRTLTKYLRAFLRICRGRKGRRHGYGVLDVCHDRLIGSGFPFQAHLVQYTHLRFNPISRNPNDDARNVHIFKPWRSQISKTRNPILPFKSRSLQASAAKMPQPLSRAIYASKSRKLRYIK